LDFRTLAQRWLGVLANFDFLCACDLHQNYLRVHDRWKQVALTKKFPLVLVDVVVVEKLS
jgi:hypothetical protein